MLRRFWFFIWNWPGHLIWVVFAYLPFLGRMSVPLTGDQKVYISTAMEMWLRGSWLKPLLFGEGSYYKPPLQYWATMIGWEIFGFNLWGTLLPSVFCVLATAWFLGAIARLLGEHRTLVNAGLWFAAAAGTVTYGTTAQMEIWICAFFSGAWWAALRFLSDPVETRNWRWMYLAFALAGALSLVKSPLYSVLWGAGFFSYLLVSGEWLLFQKKDLWRSLAAGVAVGLSWYVAILIVDGDRFWADYALRETWDKKSGNQGSALSIWTALLYFSFPLVFLVLPALAIGLRGLGGRRTAAVTRFVVCWCWPAAFFFTLYPYRIKPYLFILVPALAVAVDWGWLHAGRNRTFRITRLMTGILMLLVYSVVGVVLARAELVPFWIVTGFFAAGMMAVLCALRDWTRGLVMCGLVAVFLFRSSAVSLGESDLKGLREAIAAHPGAKVAMVDEDHGIWHEVGLISVALGSPVARLSSVEEASAFLAHGGVLVLSDVQVPVLRGKLAQNTAMSLEITPWSRWKGRVKFPYRALIVKGRAGVPDFDELTRRRFEILFNRI